MYILLIHTTLILFTFYEVLEIEKFKLSSSCWMGKVQLRFIVGTQIMLLRRKTLDNDEKTFIWQSTHCREVLCLDNRLE